jgi:hypothetical protein
LLVLDDHLAVDAWRWRRTDRQLSDYAWILGCPVIAIAGESAHPAAVYHQLRPVAVIFDLVLPLVASGGASTSVGIIGVMNRRPSSRPGVPGLIVEQHVAQAAAIDDLAAASASVKVLRLGNVGSGNAERVQCLLAWAAFQRLSAAPGPQAGAWTRWPNSRWSASPLLLIEMARLEEGSPERPMRTTPRFAGPQR